MLNVSVTGSSDRSFGDDKRVLAVSHLVTQFLLHAWFVIVIVDAVTSTPGARDAVTATVDRSFKDIRRILVVLHLVTYFLHRLSAPLRLSYGDLCPTLFLILSASPRRVTF